MDYRSQMAQQLLARFQNGQGGKPFNTGLQSFSGQQGAQPWRAQGGPRNYGFMQQPGMMQQPVAAMPNQPLPTPSAPTNKPLPPPQAPQMQGNGNGVAPPAQAPSAAPAIGSNLTRANDYMDGTIYNLAGGGQYLNRDGKWFATTGFAGDAGLQPVTMGNNPGGFSEFYNKNGQTVGNPMSHRNYSFWG